MSKIRTSTVALCPDCETTMAWAEYLQAFTCSLCAERHVLAPQDIYLEWNEYWTAATDESGQIAPSAALIIHTVE